MGIFLTHAAAIDITLLPGWRMDHAAFALPRSDTQKIDDLPYGDQGGPGRPNLLEWT